jgi:hypothetical protein
MSTISTRVVLGKESTRKKNKNKGKSKKKKRRQEGKSRKCVYSLHVETKSTIGKHRNDAIEIFESQKQHSPRFSSLSLSSSLPLISPSLIHRRLLFVLLNVIVMLDNNLK